MDIFILIEKYRIYDIVFMKRIIKLSYNELHDIIKEEIGRCNIT